LTLIVFGSSYDRCVESNILIFVSIKYLSYIINYGSTHWCPYKQCLLCNDYYACSLWSRPICRKLYRSEGL